MALFDVDYFDDDPVSFVNLHQQASKKILATKFQNFYYRSENVEK